MKNFEKYIEKLSKQICVRTITREKGNKCEECTFGLSDGSCNDEMIKQWLLEEYKKPIQLTHDEYVILKNLPKNYKYITCIKQGLTCEVYDEMPIRVGSGFWKKTQGLEKELPFIGMFQFIKYEDEPYEIAKLIADYEKENCNGKV